MCAHTNLERTVHHTQLIEVGLAHIGTQGGLHSLLAQQRIETDMSIEKSIMAVEGEMAYPIL